ncbi:MAG: YciI family protein [Gemmatimonadota bacterium]
MQYVILIHETPADFEARRPPSEDESYVAAWRAYYKALVESGVFVGGGAPLKDPGTATTVRVESGRRHVQDGPFAEAKDQLGGFMILDLESLDAALEWAARCPAAATGAVEVRPMDVAWQKTVATP